MDIAKVLDRHERIALQFSGGKDSLACLYLLLGRLGEITVYWCDSGDTFPEVRAYMDQMAAVIPNFVRIEGQQPAVVKADGWPSEVVPVTYTSWGQAVSGEKPFKVQDRHLCCLNSLNLPTHARMVADSITLIIRGQRRDEAMKSLVQSGDVIDGIEYLFPIEDWTEADVMDYLDRQEAPKLPFVAAGKHSLECLHCTGYRDHGQEAYLKEYHPEALKEYRRRIKLINAAVKESLHG